LEAIDQMVRDVHIEASEHLTPGVIGFADDLSICTTWNLANTICSRIHEHTDTAHLQLNIEKCSIIVHPDHFADLVAQNPIFANVVEGDKVLGSPTGTQEFRCSSVAQKVESMSKLFVGLDKLKLPVNAVTTLLKFCISPRVSYLSKVLDPAISMDAFLNLDAQIDAAICKTIEHSPSNEQEASVIATIRSLTFFFIY
jgi:hypothetical protein